MKRAANILNVQYSILTFLISLSRSVVLDDSTIMINFIFVFVTYPYL